MKRRQSPVKARQARTHGARKLRQVSVCNLPVADYAVHRHRTIRQAVRPEFVTWIVSKQRQNRLRGSGGLALSDEQPY